MKHQAMLSILEFMIYTISDKLIFFSITVNVTIFSGLMATVGLFIVLSTVYDIMYTMYNRKCLFIRICSLFLLFESKNRIFPSNFVYFVTSRWEISSTCGFFLLFEWNKIAFVQKIQITGRNPVFTWNACHINAMGCTWTHIYDVYEASHSKYVDCVTGKWNICSWILSLFIN